METCERREFIRAALAAACLGCAGVPKARAEEENDMTLAEDVPLGQTGFRVSPLALGTGFRGWNQESDHTRMGQEAFTKLLRHALDRGVRFIDTADLYGSHTFVRNALRGVPQDDLFVLTKLWPRPADWQKPSGGAKAEVERFRKELGCDRLGACLIHCMENERWTTDFARIRDELSELKEAKVIGAVGVSCHNHDALKVAAEDPWVDIIFARINHKGGSHYHMDGTVEEISATLARARANGKAVVGMKIFGAGRLTAPEDRDASLTYVFRNRLVDAVTIGMTDPEQVDDTIARLNRARASA